MLLGVATDRYYDFRFDCVQDFVQQIVAVTFQNLSLRGFLQKISKVATKIYF